ncbi:MAG: hypothetical protein IKF19_06000 [Bacilli bacterium]|nr:hypothetical protein [Bacilli bacterium]
MKKTDIALILGVVIIIILGCFVMKGTKAKPSYELPLTLSGDAGLHKLSYAEYQEKIDNNESFVFIVERATCSHCQNFMPVAEAFANDNKVPMYYIDTDEMDQSDWSKLEKSNSFFKKNSGNWGTPTTIVLAGNESIEDIAGETDAKSLLKLYKKYFDLEKYKEKNK